MTEQELLNKLNTVVSMAQEKILALLTDLHNEQAVAKAREVFSNYPVVLETIDVQKNEFGKTTQVGGYATPDRIVISQNDIQSIDLNIPHELENTLGTIIHEYAHKFRTHYGNLFEEASASIFAEMCINYSKVKSNEQNSELFNMVTSVDYQKAESQVRGILYALKQKNMDIGMMVEYILGDENRFRQICGQLFGSSFDNYFNQANNTPISQQFTNISEDLLTQILTEHIKNNQLSFKDYWSSGKNIASSTNLYFNGSPVLVQSVVNAGIGAIREDEKDLFRTFEYTSRVNQEQSQFIEDEKRTRIRNKLTQSFNLSGKSSDEIYDSLVDICSTYIQHKASDGEESVIYIDELKKMIPNIEEFADTFKQLRVSRLDSTILDNMDLSNISYGQIYDKMVSLMPRPKIEQHDTDFIATSDINEVARIHSDPKYASWRHEFVDGEYRFYSPTYKKQDTITFYHGGAEPDFDLNKLDVLRSSQKQQNSSNSYAGFYMYGEQNKEDAIKYARQENSLKNTNTKGVVAITMPSDIKIYTVPPFTITRITPEQIQQLQQKGYDVIAGNMVGKTEYVLLNKDKVIDMKFQPIELKQEMGQSDEITQQTQKEEDTYVTLEQLAPLLSESGYMCYGHGTGRMGNSDEVVDSIFSEGLRTKDNSLYFTTIGLSTPIPELIEQYKELGLPEPSIDDLKKQFNNWQHQDSKKIIIARIPTEYINQMGDRSDRDGEMFGAFYIQEIQPNGKETNYLDPKFIVGCFDVEKQAVRLNKNFERTLTPATIERLKSGYKRALEKTKERIDNSNLYINPNPNTEQEQVVQVPQSADQFDSFNFDFDENVEWEETTSVGKSR